MSELRQDLVSGDWVIMSPGRAKRPDQLVKKQERRKPSPKAGCPFEDLEKSGNWPPVATYPSVASSVELSPAKQFDEAPAFVKTSVGRHRKWKIAVIHNRYPALTHGEGCALDIPHGIYSAKTGVGNHEIVITRDHLKNFADLSEEDAGELFSVFQKRHKALDKDHCNAYVSTFFNWGRSAGASIWHPHYQILALPIIPPHNARSVRGAERYFKKYRRCARCDVIKMERGEKKRIVDENRSAIAISPYAVKRPFEVSILPKKHFARFAKTPLAVIRDTASLVQSVMRRMKKYLHDPDLNFFIHDAPVDGGHYSYHHWHAEIVPVNVISPLGGFEVSTVANINAVDPDMAAAILRGKKRMP